MRLNLMKLLKAEPKMDITFTERFFLKIFRVLVPHRKEKRVGKTVRQPIANTCTTEESSIHFWFVERKIGQGDCRMRSTIYNLVTILEDVKKAIRFTVFVALCCYCINFTTETTSQHSRKAFFASSYLRNFLIVLRDRRKIPKHIRNIQTRSNLLYIIIKI